MTNATTHYQVVIIGAGMSGICMGIKLLRRGIRDFVIVEKSPEPGGTWHDNTYPGACSDVPAVLYSYSFAPKPDWSRLFPPHDEIKAYLKSTAERFGLLPHLRLGEAVESAEYQDDGTWQIQLASGECLNAQALVSGLGQLNKPNIPEFEGAWRFAGSVFHSARWNHEVPLAGKRIAVIGNAASALQFIPHIAREAARLHVYQRSANYIVPRHDRLYSDGENARFTRFPLLQKLFRLSVWLRGEWLMYPVIRSDSRLLKWLWEKQCGDYLKKEVNDPVLRRQLTPDYRVGCKRILFSDEYYRAMQRSNVELVTSSILGIDEHGVLSGDGESRPVDLIIYATGFKATQMLSAVAFRGRKKRMLEDVWAGGAEAYRGVCISGFPNFFMLYGPNTNISSNSIIFLVERQCDYIVDCIDKLLKHGLRCIEANADVQRAYNDRLQGELAGTVWVGSCESWYKNAAGKVTNNWPRSTAAYWWHMRSPDFADFDMEA